MLSRFGREGLFLPNSQLEVHLDLMENPPDGVKYRRKLSEEVFVL